MKTGKTWAQGWTRWVGLAVLALPLVVLGTGCQWECVSRTDCLDKGQTPAEGEDFLCRDNRCERVAAPVADAGTDAGDAGTDAGTQPSDGGTQPTDGGTGVACADTPHDAKLGTLKLQAGFQAAESAALPAGISAVTAMPRGRDFALYGLKDADKSLYALGTWPTVAAGAQPLVGVVAPEDRTANVFLSGSLANDGTRLFSGYTKFGADFPGAVVVHDPAAPEGTRYLSAPGNYTAAGLPSVLLVNGLGLGSASGGAAVYALRTDTSPATPLRFATFVPAWEAASGPTAVTVEGIAVLGYFGKKDFKNHLHAVAPSRYTPTLQGGAPVDLGGTPEIYAGGDLFTVAGFGSGVALHRGSYDAQTFAPITQDVSHITLALSGPGLGTVSPGPRVPVLVAQDRCTEVVLLSPMGGDLLVGVADQHGRRLVRLRKP